MSFLLKFITIATISTVGLAAQTYSAYEAADHIGQRATVCGTVASTYYASRSRGKPTFLNLDQAYPNQIFTVVIFGDDRANFGRPESRYANKNICVTGKIKSYKGKPEMVIYSPKQIKIR